MTVQFNDLAAQRSSEGWIMSYVAHGGNSRIHLLDEQGEILRSLDLSAALDGYSRFAHWTTAGMGWNEQLLAYFTELQGVHYFVVRPWWGARLVISLDELCPVNSQTMAEELRNVECRLVLTALRRLVTETENGDEPEFDRSTRILHATVNTLVHFPGLLELHQAIPFLQVLEARSLISSTWHSVFTYHKHSARQLIQISLRRLGEKPRCYPVLTFVESSRLQAERAALLASQNEPIDGPTRHSRLDRIRKSTPLAEVYQLLGAPDYIEWSKAGNCWRYDIDADEPYTLLLWLAENDTVTRFVRYSPPFWSGLDICPAVTDPVLGHDGSAVVEYVDDPENYTFVGHRIELHVLQEIESSGSYPQAMLARALFDGDTSAVYPLADALEEAGDPGASRVRSWIKATDSERPPGR